MHYFFFLMFVEEAFKTVQLVTKADNKRLMAIMTVIDDIFCDF